MSLSMLQHTGRNLLAEAEDLKSAVVEPEPHFKKLKMSCKAPPSTPHSPLADKAFVESQPASVDSVSPQVLKVSVDDEYADEWVQDKDNKEQQTVLTALQVIQGLYFMMPCLFGNRPVWKQGAAVAPATGPLIMWFCDDQHEGGWYVSDKVWADKQDKKKLGTDVTVYMWMGGDKSNPLQSSCHVPFWAKKKSSGVRCMSYLVWLESELTMVQTLVQDGMGAEPIVAPECSAPSGGHGGGGGGGGNDGDNNDNMHTDGSDESHSHQVIKRGGWMEKCSKLAVAFYVNDWGRLQDLVDEMFHSSETFKKLVQKGINKHRQWW